MNSYTHPAVTLALRVLAPRAIWRYTIVPDKWPFSGYVSVIQNRITGLGVTVGTHTSEQRAHQWCKRQIEGLTWLDASETPDDMGRA